MKKRRAPRKRSEALDKMAAGGAMVPYKNASENSGVDAYAMGPDFIKLHFRNEPKIYVYDLVKPGRPRLTKMQKLAKEGKGLSGYVSRHVREDFARTE